jgi:hypothetical protein
MDITKELARFNVTDAAIAGLRDEYMALTIKDLDDKEGFALVHTARMTIKGKRVEVTKAGKDLRAESNAYNKAVLEEEKRILGLLAPIEDHLEAEEKKITDEKERIKNEARIKEEEKIKARTAQLFELGMTWNGTLYGMLEFALSYADMKEATDEQFDTFCEKVKVSVAAYMQVQLEVEKAREIEKQKLAETEAENQKLKAEKEASEKAEQQRLADIARAQELENARTEAAAKARKEEAERVEREYEEAMAKRKAETEAAIKATEKAKRDAERKAARAPDKEKLLALANQVDGIKFPTMKTEEALEILTTYGQGIMNLTKELRRKLEAL